MPLDHIAHFWGYAYAAGHADGTPTKGMNSEKWGR